MAACFCYCSKSFWDLPPRRRPSRAHQSQNDLEQGPPALSQGILAVAYRPPALSQGPPAVSTTIFGHAHRGKSAKHTAQIVRCAALEGKMAKNRGWNCYFSRK